MLNTAQSDPDLISKAEFARRRNVKPPRVSQWIEAKQIHGEALVGEGRHALIRESVAVEQLRRKLDPVQMTGNGLTTNLALPMQAQSPVAPANVNQMPLGPSQDAPRDTIEDKIKSAKLEQIERINRDARRNEAVSNGQLTDAAAARASAAREVVRLVTSFEGALSDLATAISAEFKLPQRDVLHLLRTKFRGMRATLAGESRAAAMALPETVNVELGCKSDQGD